eukprot:646696-Amphidinium_carterae.2
MQASYVWQVNVLSPACARMYLDTCRVKIIDDDAFPTNKYRDQCIVGRPYSKSALICKVLGGSESIEEIWSLGQPVMQPL